MWHHARGIVALAAAYAVAMQAILLAVGGPVAGSARFAALPICSTLGAGHSAPRDHNHDCLGACLNGCYCGGGPACPAAGSALSYAPALLQSIGAALERRQPLFFRTANAHRSRAPPLV
jgi:hypothetical protein